MFRFLSFFVFLSVCVCGQNSVDGYVVTITGDTIRGKVMDRNTLFDSTTYQHFKVELPDGKTMKFDPKGVRMYTLEGYPRYTPIRLENGRRYFAEIQEEGPIILYRAMVQDARKNMGAGVGAPGYSYMNAGGGWTNVSGTPGNSGSLYYKSEYYIEKRETGKYMKIPSFYFKTYLDKYFKDDPVYAEACKQLPPVYENFRQFIRLYNSLAGKK